MNCQSTNNINNLIERFNFVGEGKFKLIVLFGLLGDFDSFEYAINLKSFIDKNQDINLMGRKNSN